MSPGPGSCPDLSNRLSFISSAIPQHGAHPDPALSTGYGCFLFPSLCLQEDCASFYPQYPVQCLAHRRPSAHTGEQIRERGIESRTMWPITHPGPPPSVLQLVKPAPSSLLPLRNAWASCAGCRWSVSKNGASEAWALRVPVVCR